MKLSRWRWLSCCTSSFFGKYSRPAILTILAVSAICITASLMVRASIDDAIQFHRDLNDLYEFLRGQPLAPR